jgi:hypothetical protein
MRIDRVFIRALRPFGAALILAVATFGTYSGMAAAADIEVKLSGAQEVPPNRSAATGMGKIVFENDRSLTGSVTTTGMVGTAAHIHEGAAGVNGPVVIPLTKNGDTYTVPAGIKLSDSHFASLQLGNLYINVHSATYPGGEVRGQLILPTFR